jgi:hypothetical protein
MACQAESTSYLTQSQLPGRLTSPTSNITKSSQFTPPPQPNQPTLNLPPLAPLLHPPHLLPVLLLPRQSRHDHLRLAARLKANPPPILVNNHILRIIPQRLLQPQFAVEVFLAGDSVAGSAVFGQEAGGEGVRAGDACVRWGGGG